MRREFTSIVRCSVSGTRLPASPALSEPEKTGLATSWPRRLTRILCIGVLRVL